VTLKSALSSALAAAAGAHLLPSVLTIPALHQRLVPRLSGASSIPHVALTFDDGPDAESTPAFLDALGQLEVQATFFVLGSQLERHPATAKRIVAEGHELAVHGWRHTPHLLRVPWRIRDDIARTRDLIVRTCDVVPRYWRPPNGVVTGAGLAAAGSLGLRPVLWTADGQDWQASATAETIRQRVTGQLHAGGVVLLHDSDITSAPESWRAALDALGQLVSFCRRHQWEVGPVREHWS
jgi:peptidoglycan/xylan/chitin deacetylase (PgdA/CDA1 family)